MSRNRLLRDEGVKTAAAQAAIMASQRVTCEMCVYLRGIRPKCAGEGSPHYRLPRETFHASCGLYAPKGSTPSAKPAPTPEPPPASRAEIAGAVSKRKHNRWARGATA